MAKNLDIEDEREENKLQLEVERRSFDQKDVNFNGALEGSELESFIDPPNVNWYESEVAHLIHKLDKDDDNLLSQVYVVTYVIT